MSVAEQVDTATIEDVLTGRDHEDTAGNTVRLTDAGFTAEKARTGAMLWKMRGAVKSDDENLTDREAAAQIAKSAGLWHSTDGTAYATLTIDGHREHVPIRSSRFKFWLVREFRAQRAKAPSTDALSIAMTDAEADAVMEGAKHEVHIRTAHEGGKLFVDLCNDAWEVVEVDADGWRVVTDPPVKFFRTEDMKALPTPVRGGSLEDLRPFVNAGTDDDWSLMLAWLVGCMSEGPYALLALSGAGGSAKTTTAAYLRRTFDPTGTPSRRRPRLEDLPIAAKWSAVLSFDNLSGLSRDLSDALCTLVTGDGMGKRTLYTDDAEKLFFARRPIILTGIEQIVTAGDLISRTIPLALPTVEGRRTERDLEAAWEEAHPGILGSLLAAASSALRRLDETPVPEDVRMADFAQWVQASGAVPGFTEAYRENREEARATEIESSPFCAALIGHARDSSQTEDGGRWSGTSAELLRVVTAWADGNGMERGDYWPKTDNKVWGRIQSHAAALGAAGLTVDRRRSNGRRLIELSLGQGR